MKNNLTQSNISEFFGNKREIFQASAPGRMDVMGGIADYSGSLVLQMPIKERTSVSLSVRKDDTINIRSIDGINETHDFSIELNNILNNGKADYDFARSILLKSKGGDWAIYVIACLLILKKEKDISLKGMDIFIESHVPIGKGVSSSAALEVATLIALTKLYNISLEKIELATLAQQAENKIVGSPCGLMDQLASHLGEEGKLLPILCQPDKIYQALSIPEGIQFCGIDSGVKHSVSGNSYGDVRIAAFMGYTIIALAEGCKTETLKSAKINGDWSTLPYKGYLANISPSDFEVKYKCLLPTFIKGIDFKGLYELSIDTATEIKDDGIYAVRSAAQHPVYERFRVSTFASLLNSLAGQNAERNEILNLMGELMYQSHVSYTACGLGNEQTDELVEMVKKAGESFGVFGAKITGGGSGGTVCILADGKKGMETARRIREEYSKKHNLKVHFFDSGN